jgi:hypothetical protein
MSKNILDPKYPLSYEPGVVPPTYICGSCGATGCKLWRLVNVEPENQALQCLACRAEQERPEISSINLSDTEMLDSEKHPTFWNRMPAIPDESNTTLLNFESAPTKATLWWGSLPSFPPPPQ